MRLLEVEHLLLYHFDFRIPRSVIQEKACIERTLSMRMQSIFVRSAVHVLITNFLSLLHSMD